MRNDDRRVKEQPLPLRAYAPVPVAVATSQGLLDKGHGPWGDGMVKGEVTNCGLDRGGMG